MYIYIHIFLAAHPTLIQAAMYPCGCCYLSTIGAIGTKTHPRSSRKLLKLPFRPLIWQSSYFPLLNHNHHSVASQLPSERSFLHLNTASESRQGLTLIWGSQRRWDMEQGHGQLFWPEKSCWVLLVWTSGNSVCAIFNFRMNLCKQCKPVLLQCISALNLVYVN